MNILRSISAIRLPPSIIRRARDAIVWGMSAGLRPHEMLKLMATATPDRNCSNFGCDACHIAEDCQLQPMCEGCGAYRSHFSHHCTAKCWRCGLPGHLARFCGVSKHFQTNKILRARLPLRLERPEYDPPRWIGGFMERIWDEVEEYRSARADSMARESLVPQLRSPESLAGRWM